MPTETTEGADTGVEQADAGNGQPETGDVETGNDLTAIKDALAKERKARRDAEKRAKDLEPFEKKQRELEEASQSEAQKLTSALNAEKDARTKAETALLRYTIGAEKQVPLNLVRFLTGETADEIKEAADALLKEIGGVKPSMPGKPSERNRLSNGRPSGAEGSDDPMELIKQARRLRD